MDHNGRIVDMGIDWITLTAPEGELADRLILRTEALGYLGMEVGNIMRPWAAMGYHGTKCGPVAWGRRERGAVAVVSGALANDAFYRLSSDGGNCTRLDIQVTVRWTPDRLHVAEEAYRAIKAKPTGGRHDVGARLLQGSDGGSTCYVGARSSEGFARLYDKAVESGDPEYAGCWRYEVETKGGYAVQLAAMLRERQGGPSGIAAIVHRFFAERGHVPAFIPAGDAMDFQARRGASDVERKLEWLRVQVAPTLHSLSALGYEKAWRAALAVPIGVDMTPLILADDRFGSHGAL